MSSQESTTPREHSLSLRLRSHPQRCRDDFQLGYPNFEGYCAIVLEATRPVVLFCRGLSEEGHLDVADALSSGLLELVDHAAQTVVTFPHVEQPTVGQRDIVPNPYRDETLKLDLDSSAQIWKDTLEAGKTYVLRLGPAAFDENVLWCRYRDADNAADEAVQNPPLRLQRNKTVSFTVYHDPDPPTFTGVFSVEPAVCHVPPSDPNNHIHNMDPLPNAFKFVVDITSNAPAPITVCIQQSVFGSTLPFGGLSSLDEFADCVDAESGEKAHFPFGCMCFDSNPWPEWPDDEDLVEIPPAGSAAVRFVQEFGEYDQTHSFKPGRRYRAQMSRGAKGGFYQWMFGTKEQILRGTVEERKARWDEAHPRGRREIEVQQVNEPVEFDAVN
ncbi:hypothetical protein DIS24_g10309 [Lasiodiplodia hormozganensis]|uniref:Uncharacterized protein n=1 Tax=Lasiodiplodia hormozganensis TaxID=869390 RepID=A0AA39XQI8_9PEZI|nr:hypothetical protein DIS24_g10309 [Lasiodiplodia hormozganensis]